MRRQVSKVLEAILHEFGKAPDKRGDLDDKKVLAAIARDPVPAAGPGARVFAHHRVRKNSDVKPAFNPHGKTFALSNTPGAQSGGVNPAWKPPADKEKDKEAKALAGLRFLLDTVYLAEISTSDGLAKFVVYLWRRTDAQGNVIPGPPTTPYSETFELVDAAKLKVMNLAWPTPGAKDVDEYLRTYKETKPLTGLRPDTGDKIPLDIRRVLALANPPQRKKGETAAAAESGEKKGEEEDEEDAMELDSAVPAPRARVGGQIQPRATLLQQLQAKFSSYVRLSGHTDVTGRDTLDPPADMKAEFAQLNVLPVRLGFAATMGPSDRWLKSPLLNPNSANRAAHALQTGKVTLAEERHAIEDAILLRRSETIFFILAVLEHWTTSRAITFTTGALREELAAMYKDDRVLKAMGTTISGIARIAQRWSMVPDRATRSSDETLSHVVANGEVEDAIIWLLLHAVRVGPCVVDSDGGMRRALLVQDGPDSVVWVALTTPGNGEGLTWSSTHASAAHPDIKSSATVHDSWGGFPEQARMDMATKILQRQLPSWQGISTLSL